MDTEVLERDVEDLKEQMKEMQKDIKRMTENRHEDNRNFVEQINKLNINMELQNQSLKTLLSTQHDFKESLKELMDEISAMKEEPAKNWKTVLLCIATSVVAGVVSYFLSKAGLK